jgi:hypothetical protein
MPRLSYWMQWFAFVGSVYVAFRDSVLKGIVLFVFVAVLHWIGSMVAFAGVWFHTKTLSAREREQVFGTLGVMEFIGIRGIKTLPPTWRKIRIATDVLFAVLTAWVVLSVIFVLPHSR